MCVLATKKVAFEKTVLVSRTQLRHWVTDAPACPIKAAEKLRMHGHFSFGMFGIAVN